jgi:hypothetical protein
MNPNHFALAAAIAVSSTAAVAQGGSIAVDQLTYGSAAFSTGVAGTPSTPAAAAAVRAGVGEQALVFVDSHGTRTRAEVVAEVREAARLGVLTYGEAGPRPTTAEQEAQIARAGRAAALAARGGQRSPG